MKKRIISLILALALCVGMLPAPVFAEEAPGAQTLEKEVVSQNEEPQPEPAPQNEEGQEPQGEPEQGEPQEEPQGEPQEEPEQEEPPVQSVLKANAPMAVAEGENGEEVTLTVGEQNGKLFDGVNSAATFPVTCENGNLNSLKITFSPENSDLTAAVSEDGTTVTVMTAGNAKAGIYQMTLALGQTSQTVSVIVDVPFTIKNREIQVASDQTSATLTLEVDVAPELEGQVQYIWMPDGKNSVVTNTNTVTLCPDNLKQDENSPGRYSAWVDCRVSCGTYFGTATRKFVKIIACDHLGAILYTKEGTCRGCGQLCPEDRPFITEDGVAIQIAQNANTPFALDDWFPGTLYLWEDYTRGTDLDVGTLDGNGTLELQNHNVYSKLILDDFQGHSFKIYDGYLTQLTLNQAGSLILENVTIENPLTVPAGTDLEIKKNVEFKNRVSFNGPAKLTGGTFNAGLSHQDEQDEPHSCLELLAPGYAFADGNKEIIDASRESISGKVQVVSHPTCTYKADKAGKCDCGRSCPHESLNEQGYCTVCKMLVEPFAIGEQGYRSLEEAQTAAQEGQTIYLRGDYELPNPVVISKNITLDVCGYTLSGSSENALLQITGTDVTVQKEDIWNTQAPAVTVKSGANLTVKTASFGGGSDHVLVVEQGGRADVHNGGFLHGVLYVDGSLDMEGCFQANLKLGPNVGKISIVEGNFDSITLAGGKEYKDLLAEGSAYWADGAWVKLVEAQEKTPVVIAECPHQDGLAGSQACPYCGKTCGHGNMDQETGCCKDCGYQVYKAKVDERMKYTFQEAMDAAQAGKTVTLLADDSLGGNLTLDKKITLNINGCTLKTRYFTVQAPLTICGGGEIESDFSFNAQVTVQGTRLKAHKGVVEKGGSLCIDQGATVNLVSVFPGGSLELKQGTVGILYVADGGKARLSSGTVTQKLEMEKGNILSILPQGKALEKDGKIVNGNESNVVGPVTVVDHTHMFDGSTTCPCGYTVAATLDTEAGKQYFADFSIALEAAKAASGSTLTLFQDVALTGESNLYIDSGTFTIDWNGHTISGEMSNVLLCITDAAKVTLTDSVGTGGLRNVRGAAIGAYVGSQGSLTIRGGVYSPQLWKDRTAYGPIQISGGRFESPEDSGRNGALYCYSGSLAELLAPGYTFAYEDDELFDVYSQRKSDSYKTVYAVAHTHDSFDEDGVCACGYTCPHEHWTDGMCDLCGKICPHDHYENGKCTVCGYPCPHEDVTENGGVYTCDICGLTMTVMVETADGISYTTDLAAALNNAEDGTTVKLLSDLVLTADAKIIGGNKTVTLNLNGHNITRATWQTISVKGNTDDGTKAKLVITGSGKISFEVKAIGGGQLDMSGWTGTVGFVDLENACDFVGPTGDGHLRVLNISNWRSDNKGTILLQGGTIGKLWRNSFESFQMTLGSLLKSGYAAKSGSEYLPYDYAIQNGGSVDNLTIEPCPHTGLDSSGRCTYCNATGFVASVTKDGVTAGYTDFLSALDEICDGKRGTLKLLKDVPVEEGHPFGRISGILDLNGKNLACDLTCIQGSSLQIVNRGSDMSRMERLEVYNGAKVTIADTAGSIHFNVVWVEIGSVADLLPEGGAYIAHDGTWISAADAAAIQSLEKVAVKEAPVKSVTLTANKTSVPYGESQTVTLTASATLSEGGTASYAWAEVKSDGTVQTFTEEVETSFTLPAGVNAGEHTYRVSVTVGDYTLSKDIQITVTKAPGTLVNKDYPTEFTYGDTVPTPKAENFTSNHPDGTFSYRWLTGDGSIILEAGANPTRAGTYMLYATWTAGTNHTTASLSLAVTIQKAAQTANIAVVNETISGKGDGGVTLLPSAEGYEIRKKGETTFEPIEASQGQTFMTLTPGVTYEIRLAETKNYLPSAIQEITVQPGRKLKVTLPENQKGYTLTASKTQLDWHEDVELTFQLDSVGAYKAADFGIWAEAGSEKTKLTLGNDGAVTLTAPEKNITITVTGVRTDNVAPQASIRGRLRKDSGYYVKWEGFQKNPADDYVNGDFVISATDRLSGVADFWYYLSDKPLTLEELKGMNGAFWARPANQGKVSITEDGVYYLYAKALDKANNAGYACTGKLVKESNPPTFSGVKDGETYYVSQQMEIHDDGMPDWYMTNGSIGEVPNGGNENPIKLRLPNNGSSYTFTVGDRCGNEASITVYMKPLSDLTQPLDSILEDTIRKSDRATLDKVEATLNGLDVTYATEPEKKEINDALARIAQLRQVLDQVAAVEAQIDALPDSVEPYQQTVEDTQIKPARQAYSDLTDHQKTLVDSTKLDKLVRLEAQLNAWTITEGDGQTWYKGSWNPLSFTVNGQTRKFSKVLLDGKMHITATPSFLAVSGSIDEPFTLTLKPEFLQVWMKPGEHTLAVIYGENNSGTGTVTFTVEIPANYLDVTNKPEFDGKTTVTVDGKEYPIEEMNGTRYVNLPETGDLLTIYSFKDGTPTGSCTNYPIGMQVFRITRQEGGAKAEEITEFANLLNYAGCSIRLTGTKGIRMITGIGESVRKSLTGAQGLAGYTLEEYGTVVMRGVGTPTLENSHSYNFAYKKGKADPIFSRANGMIQYTNVLVGFSLEDCKDTLTLRPYIKLRDMTTGETVTLYGGCVSRSIGYIAKQNENTYKPGTAGYKYVHEIIDAVYGKTEQGGETK